MLRHLFMIVVLAFSMAAIAITALPVVSIAQEDIPLTAPCDPPALPESFETQADFDRFKEEADAYKACIDTFVTKHQNLMDRHQQAANTAIETWNSFAAEVNKLNQEQEEDQ